MEEEKSGFQPGKPGTGHFFHTTYIIGRPQKTHIIFNILQRGEKLEANLFSKHPRES
jgi:hypothetical protein